MRRDTTLREITGADLDISAVLARLRRESARWTQRSCSSLTSFSEPPEEPLQSKMDEANASAIQLNNTLSHNSQTNGNPQHPDSQTASEYARPLHVSYQCSFIVAQTARMSF